MRFGLKKYCTKAIYSVDYGCTKQTPQKHMTFDTLDLDQKFHTASRPDILLQKTKHSDYRAGQAKIFDHPDRSLIGAIVTVAKNRKVKSL